MGSGTLSSEHAGSADSFDCTISLIARARPAAGTINYLSNIIFYQSIMTATTTATGDDSNVGNGSPLPEQQQQQKHDGSYSEFLEIVNSSGAEQPKEANVETAIPSSTTNNKHDDDDDDVEAGLRKRTTTTTVTTTTTSSATNNSTGDGRRSVPGKRLSSGALSRRASTTEERRNPFAQREGNKLIWRDVTMKLVSVYIFPIVST